MESIDRNKTIDILRGFGIILMIMGHIGLGYQPYESYFSIWYHAFHMPMFYVIAGYFFECSAKRNDTFIRKKAKTLLVPFFLWALAYLVYSYLQSGDWNTFRDNAIQIIIHPTHGGTLIGGAIWFLPALFWSNTIYFYLNKLIQNKPFMFILSLTLGVCGMYATEHGVFLPLGLDAAIVAVAFISTGDQLYKMREGKIGSLLLHMKWYVYIPLFIIINILIFVNPEVNFRKGWYGIYLLTYINAVFGTLLLWNLSSFLEKCGTKNGVICIANTILSSIGCNTLVYVCTNQWMILYILPAFTVVCGECWVVQLLARLLTLIAVCFTCHVAGKVLESNSQLKYFIGK